MTCGVYVHLNPVRVKALGQGKDQRKRERAGFLPKEPTKTQIQTRLDKLRNYRWSSYRAYAGYAVRPEWLTCQPLWERCCPVGKDAKTEYRRYLEDYLRQGIEEGVSARITAALAIGGTAFVEGLRQKVPEQAGCETNARAWHRLLPFGEVVRAVESVKGCKWADFAERKGDWGRDLALHVGRMRCGLTLRELGAQAGGMSVHAVSKACSRMAGMLQTDRKLKAKLGQVGRVLNGTARG